MQKRNILIELEINSSEEVADIIARRLCNEYADINPMLNDVIGRDCPVMIGYSVGWTKYDSE